MSQYPNPIFKKIYIYSIRLLSKQDYSQHKFKQRLKKKFIPFSNISNQNYDETNTDTNTEREILTNIDSVITALIEKKYLNEEHYIRIKLSSLCKRGYSNKYIINYMNQEKIDLSNIEVQSILDSLNINNISIFQNKMKKYILKKSLDIKDFKSSQKVYTYFASKGFSFNEIQETMNSLQQ